MTILENLRSQFSSLPPFILSKIAAIISDYERELSDLSEARFDTCPKCHEAHVRITKAGKTSTGKQMYRCKSCQARFTADHGTLFFYSHQDEISWNEFIRQTISCTPMKETAESLDICESTAFRMRHKLMLALEADEDRTLLSGSVELDEKYLIKSHKGLKMKDIKGQEKRRACH